MKKSRLAILLSGRGSNFLALHRAIDSGEIPAEIVLVLSNIADAPGLSKARDLGLETLAIPHRGLKRSAHEAKVIEALREAEVEWVCLAGYMRLLGKGFIEAFPQRIVNIHPSLLPAFPGLDAQGQAFRYGVKVTGCTVHLVDDGMDTGPIVMQEAVSAEGAESISDLSARILEIEHRLYPTALKRLLGEPWRLEERRVIFGEA